jgi:hypothetical protein
MQSIFSNALIRGDSKTHRLVGHKARDAVVAGALDHAAQNDMPVAAGGVCGGEADVGFDPVRQREPRRRDECAQGAGADGGEGDHGEDIGPPEGRPAALLRPARAAMPNGSEAMVCI